MDKPERHSDIGLYVGQKRQAEAAGIAESLEGDEYRVVKIGSEEPDCLDISVNGIIFTDGDAQRVIETLLAQLELRKAWYLLFKNATPVEVIHIILERFGMELWVTDGRVLAFCELISEITKSNERKNRL